MTDSEGPIKTALLENDSLLRVTLARPKANILDREMLEAIREAVSNIGPTVRTILFEGEGKHFSFGASVEEHRPGEVEKMLPTFHQLFRELAASNRVLLAAVNGFCLGGGLELVVFCHRVFASAGSQFGNPEIKLAVFAPISSLVLPYRCRQQDVDDLVLTGRNVEAEEALALGVIDELVDDPAGAALEWHQTHLAGLSGAALRHAVRASRYRLYRDVEEVLPELERLYLKDLMGTRDAVEGITAFLEKREPVWTHE